MTGASTTISASAHVTIKIDITTGDSIVPSEIEYGYRLILDERAIPIMAYSPCAIWAYGYRGRVA